MKWLIHLAFFSVGICDDLTLIKQARLDQNEAIAKGNVELAASFWTEDVTLRRGLGSALTGKEAYTKALDATVYIRLPTSIDVSEDWPLAFESGTWTAQKDDKDLMSGKYSAQWVKREDKWLIRSEVFVALKCQDDCNHYEALP